MIDRRRLLALLPAALIQARISAQTTLFKRKPKPKPLLPSPLVYFGTDTAKPGAKGVYVARFDPNKGQLSTPMLAAPSLRPAYMALNEVAARNQTKAQAKHVLYVCNEGDAKTSTISTYQVDPNSGALNLLGQVPSGGDGPCYIAVDTSGRSAYVANYAGGTIASYVVLKDGTLSQPVERIDFHNQKLFGHHGPNAARQMGPHPHSAMVSPDNRFLVVNDLGNDDIAIFPIDINTAKLGPPHLFTGVPPGSGPRHIAFHPNGRWAYGIDEMACRIDQYLWTSAHASPGIESEALLTDTGHSVSTLDANFHGTNTAAEVMVAPSGNFLYASNRGEDSIVCFQIDETVGLLKFVQRISCGGKTPRHFTLDNTGEWLICGNQDSASVTVFARHPGTGTLNGPVQTVPLESVMFTLFV